MILSKESVKTSGEGKPTIHLCPFDRMKYTFLTKADSWQSILLLEEKAVSLSVCLIAPNNLLYFAPNNVFYFAPTTFSLQVLTALHKRQTDATRPAGDGGLHIGQSEMSTFAFTCTLGKTIQQIIPIIEY